MARRTWLVMLAVLAAITASVEAQRLQDFSRRLFDSKTGQAFLQTYSALKLNYLESVSDEVVIQGAIRGMLETLDDPYTVYETPLSARLGAEDLSGQVEGVAVLLRAQDRSDGTRVEIVDVYRDSTASAAGLLRGDLVVTIDGRDVRDETVEVVADLMRGPSGTEVSIGVLRSGHTEPLSFNIVREPIDIVSVESTMLPGSVGYVKISTFSNMRVYEQLVEQLASLERQGMTSLILDLRDNGGGLLNQSVLVADEFLSEGPIVFQRSRGMTQRLATADPHALTLPMVVLVNENSASASEVVAGALQDNGRVLVVGETTFGKGVGQSVISLANGGRLAYVSFEWLTPGRRSINEHGIEPDVRVQDTRFPSIVSLQGHGAKPYAEITVIVGKEAVGTTTADEDGAFRFFQPLSHPIESEQGEALVDLQSDHALRVAYETVTGLEARAR